MHTYIISDNQSYKSNLCKMWRISTLDLQRQKSLINYSFQSSSFTRLAVPLEIRTHQAASLFSNLSSEITECNNFNQFCKLTKNILKDRAQAH